MRAILNCETGEVEHLPDEPATLDDLKAAKLVAVTAAYDERRQRFPYSFDGVTEHLQLRDGSNDARNWMILQRRAIAQVDAGNGAANSPLPVVVESNAAYVRTYQQIADMLEAMEDWGSALMAVSWQKKAQVRAAASPEALEAISATEGWP